MRRSFVAVALAVVAIGVSAVQAQAQTAPPAQQPAAAPAQAPAADPLKFTGVEDVLLDIQVKPNMSADFEAGFKEMMAALAASPKPELVAHGKTMMLSKVNVAPPDGSSLYVLHVNKPSADLSYNVGLILFYSGKPQGAAYDGPIATQDAALVIYKKIQDNIMNITPWPLAKIGG